MRNVRATSVYVIESDQGLIKIGRSFEPGRRLRQLERASGATLRLCHSTDVRDDASLLEAIAHQVLAHKRRAGEWFEVSADDAIAAIGTAMAEISRREEYARCKACKPAAPVRFFVEPRPGCKGHPVSVRLAPEMKARLQALADSEGRSMSNYVETHLLRYIEAEEAQKKIQRK